MWPAARAHETEQKARNSYVPPMVDLGGAMPDLGQVLRGYGEPQDAVGELVQAEQNIGVDMNTKAWPKTNSKNQNRDQFGYGDVEFEWAPPSNRRKEVPDPDKKGAMIWIPGYIAMCCCPNPNCIRFQGDVEEGLPRGLFGQQYDDVAALEACKVSTNYCKKCYHKEWERCKVKSGCHNGRHAKGRSPAHKVLSKVLPMHIANATPASQIDHEEYAERVHSEDELPATKAEKKKKKRKSTDLTEPEPEPVGIGPGSDGIVYAAEVILPELGDMAAVADDEAEVMAAVADEVNSFYPKMCERPIRRRDPEEYEKKQLAVQAKKTANKVKRDHAKAHKEEEKTKAKLKVPIPASAQANKRAKVDSEKSNSDSDASDDSDWNLTPINDAFMCI